MVSLIPLSLTLDMCVGYIEASNCLDRECNLDLYDFDVADNIDLYYVVQDYEEYFEIKFNRKPKLIKKSEEALPS